MKALFALAAVGVMAAGALAGGANCQQTCTKNKEVQVVNAAAKDGKEGCAASCTKSGAQVVNASSKDAACAATCEAQKAAMAAKVEKLGIPYMTFQVGDKTTHCPMEAFAFAKEANVMPVATFNGKKYDCVETAMTDWQNALSDKLTSMTQVSYVVDGKSTQCCAEASEMAKSCSKPVITRVATKEYSCQQSAQTAALKAVQAADAVPFVMVVAGAEYHCPGTAADASRISGQPVTYKVNGVETCCEKTAMCVLLLSRIIATADALETAKVDSAA